MVRRTTGAENAELRAKALQEMPESMRTASTPAKPDNTKATVAGYDASGYAWSHPSGPAMRLWVGAAPPLKALGELLQKTEDVVMGGGTLPGTPRHGDFGGLILRFTMNWGAGQEPAVLSITSIKEQPVPTSLFEVPADYKDASQGR
jgi:hypothetical protein